MIYAAIDVSLQANPKAIKAGSAMYLWTYAMLWSRDQKESGHVPMHVLLACPWGSRRENALASKTLVEVSLFLIENLGPSKADEGIRIWNYEKKNDTRETIDKRIEDNRSKQAKFRKSKRLGVTEVSPVTPGADAGAGVVFKEESGGPPPPEASAEIPPESASGTRPVTASAVPEPEPSEPAPKVDAKTRYRQTYCAHIELGKGSPYAFPSGKAGEDAAGDLHTVLVTFAKASGKPLRGGALIAWLGEHVEQFARYVLAETSDPKYLSFNPGAFLGWMNKGCPGLRRVSLLADIARAKPTGTVEEPAGVCPQELLDWANETPDYGVGAR